MRCLDRKRRSKGMEMLMAGQSSDDLLAMFDGAPLNRRYWLSFGLLSAITVLDFFDFFLIAFILSKIGPEWQLTYGQSGLILYGGGIGAILGALVWGSLSDVLGRKLQIVTGTMICALLSAVSDRGGAYFGASDCPRRMEYSPGRSVTSTRLSYHLTSTVSPSTRTS